MFRSIGSVLVATGFLFSASCSGPEKRQTPAEWLRENTIILEQLRSYDEKERREGVNRFLRLGREQGIEVVAFLLDDPSLKEDYRIEVVLARILADWKDSRAIPFLVSFLKHADRGAVGIAREGLVIFGEDPAVFAAFDELLRESDQKSREVAAAFLSEQKSPRAAELLAEHRRSEEDREIRALCVFALLETRHERRAELLVEALSDADAEIRQTAWQAVSRLKPTVRFNPRGAPEEREKAVGELKRWAAGYSKANRAVSGL